MKAGEIEIVMRAVVPVEDIRAGLCPHLEVTEDDVWLSRKQCGRRYTFRGVPARRVDVVIVDGYDLRYVAVNATEPSDLAIVEIGRKSGRYDGAERDRIAIRPWNRGLAQQTRHGRLFVRAEKKPTVAVRVEWTATNEEPYSRWEREYQRLRWALDDDGGGYARIVTWHWSRYYTHLPAAEVGALASAFVPPAGATLAEANREASRQLYRLARDLGWRKLTARERARLRLDGAQWQREEVVAERRAAVAGLRADGVGEATHVAAATGGWPAD